MRHHHAVLIGTESGSAFLSESAQAHRDLILGDDVAMPCPRVTDLHVPRRTRELLHRTPEAAGGTQLADTTNDDGLLPGDETDAVTG